MKELVPGIGKLSAGAGSGSGSWRGSRGVGGIFFYPWDGKTLTGAVSSNKKMKIMGRNRPPMEQFSFEIEDLKKPKLDYTIRSNHQNHKPEPQISPKTSAENKRTNLSFSIQFSSSLSPICACACVCVAAEVRSLGLGVLL